MKKLLLISLILSLFSTNIYAFSYADFVELDEASSPEDMSVDHLRRSKLKTSSPLAVDVYMRNFRDSDKEKVYKAVEILETVINSQEFKDRV